MPIRLVGAMAPLALLAVTACASTLVAYPLDDRGVRAGPASARAIPYHLPRPYLLVAENVAPAGADARKGASAAPGRWYQIVYLPDLSRRYGLEMRPGLGSYDGEIVLEHGWMFTGAHFQADPQIDETLAALAELAGESGKLATATRQAQRSGEPGAPPAASLALYDLVDGACVAAWPNGCGEVTSLGVGLCRDAAACPAGSGPEGP